MHDNPTSSLAVTGESPSSSLSATDDQVHSATEPDWTRERVCSLWDPSRKLIRSIRRHQACQARGRLWAPLRMYWVIVYRFWSVVTGADIPLSTRLGGGLLIPHPCGIVIHCNVVIGPNCLIFQGVTIGTNRSTKVPRLGGNVDVGSGAKILGDVTIGDHARIGANAVVLHDVPAGATAVGVPARIVSNRNSSL
jgi:serine O-acetyltransferase